MKQYMEAHAECRRNNQPKSWFPSVCYFAVCKININIKANMSQQVYEINTFEGCNLWFFGDGRGESHFHVASGFPLGQVVTWSCFCFITVNHLWNATHCSVGYLAEKVYERYLLQIHCEIFVQYSGYIYTHNLEIQIKWWRVNIMGYIVNREWF